MSYIRMKYDTGQIISKFIEVHGNTYCYEDFEYCGYHAKSTILCKLHGNFYQSPAKHLSGRGCRYCASEEASIRNSLGKEGFTAKAEDVHGTLYSYDNVNYINNRAPVVVTCRIHGDFKILPSSHLKGGRCKYCIAIETSKLKSCSQDDVIKSFENVHNGRYDYSKVYYHKDNTKVIVICNSHGEFSITPSNHKRGKGCAKCAVEDNFWYSVPKAERCKDKLVKVPSGVYLLKINTIDGYFYKIGISSSIGRRIKEISSSSGFVVEVIYNVKVDLYSAIKFENLLHKKYADFSLKLPKYFDGYTECFNEDLPIKKVIACMKIIVDGEVVNADQLENGEYK